MFTVALIGADGAGKTTVGRRLEAQASLPIKYIYMGVSPHSSNVMLPTTRLVVLVKRLLGKGTDIAGPPDPTKNKPRPRSLVKRWLGALKTNLRVANQLAEEWFRQGVVGYYLRQKYIVVFDRHFFSDYYAYDVAGEDPNRPLFSRLHGFLLDRFYPKPSLVILLDAPVEVLLARKGEGTAELLQRRRQEYLDLQQVVAHFYRVDATQPIERVVKQVTQLIQDFYQDSSGKSMQPDASKKKFLGVGE